MITVHRVIRESGMSINKGCTNRVDCPCAPVMVVRGEVQLWIHQPRWYVNTFNDEDVKKALEERDNGMESGNKSGE